MVFPTHVGVFPGTRPTSTQAPCLPHARGGVSGTAGSLIAVLESSPRTWGCFPVSAALRPAASSLPHARGGVSALAESKSAGNVSSPRTWGCFQDYLILAAAIKVFPTHVGVFPAQGGQHTGDRGLPHARGGVSQPGDRRETGERSSPRTWGCFLGLGGCPLLQKVFPTHVGVFPGAAGDDAACLRLPHARGGVSHFPLLS